MARDLAQPLGHHLWQHAEIATPQTPAQTPFKALQTQLAAGFAKTTGSPDVIMHHVVFAKIERISLAIVAPHHLMTVGVEVRLMALLFTAYPPRKPQQD
jgi:hypothetical protein